MMLIDTDQFEKYKKSLSELRLKVLPDDAPSYFEITANTFLLQLEQLRPQRARRKGIINANLYMLQAYNGEIPKRPPITVTEKENFLYLIIDGNSTYANALMSGWKSLPCVIGIDDRGIKGDQSVD